jgi:hypothetical protein
MMRLRAAGVFIGKWAAAEHLFGTLPRVAAERALHVLWPTTSRAS